MNKIICYVLKNIWPAITIVLNLFVLNLFVSDFVCKVHAVSQGDRWRNEGRDKEGNRS